MPAAGHVACLAPDFSLTPGHPGWPGGPGGPGGPEGDGWQGELEPRKVSLKLL